MRGPHHPNCIVVYRRRLRDWFRKSYWVVCIYCDEAWGPFVTRDGAWAKATLLNNDSFRAIAAGVAP